MRRHDNQNHGFSFFGSIMNSISSFLKPKSQSLPTVTYNSKRTRDMSESDSDNDNKKKRGSSPTGS